MKNSNQDNEFTIGEIINLAIKLNVCKEDLEAKIEQEKKQEAYNINQDLIHQLRYLTTIFGYRSVFWQDLFDNTFKRRRQK